MIDVADIINDPDYAKDYTILRSNGFFDEGGFTETITEIPDYSAVLPTNTKDLEQVPEADRISGSMTFYSSIPLFVTRNNDTDRGNSDKLRFKNELYKIVKLLDYSDFGLYKAIATRISGN